MRSITRASGYEMRFPLDGRDVRPAAGAIDRVLAVGEEVLEIRLMPVHVGRDDRELDRTVDLIIDPGTLTFQPRDEGVGTREDEHLGDGDPEAVPAGLQVQFQPLPGGDEIVDR